MNEQERPEATAKEKESKLEFSFFYSPHLTADDFRGLKELLDKADIYIPEQADWTADGKLAYEEIAEGTYNPKDLKSPMPGSANREELDVLYNSHKIIFFADLPQGHHLIEKLDEVSEKNLNSVALFLQGNFDEALSLRKKSAEEDVSIQREREEFIKKQITENLPQFIKNNEALKDRVRKKESIRVLLSLGNLHTPLHHDLKNEGYDAAWVNQSPLTYSFSLEVQRRLQFNKSVDDELLARSLLESALAWRLGELTSDTNKIHSVLRKMASRLNFEDIRAISTRVGVLGKSFVAELASCGISIPASEEEIDDMLSKNNF